MPGCRGLPALPARLPGAGRAAGQSRGVRSLRAPDAGRGRRTRGAPRNVPAPPGHTGSGRQRPLSLLPSHLLQRSSLPGHGSSPAGSAGAIGSPSSPSQGDSATPISSLPWHCAPWWAQRRSGQPAGVTRCPSGCLSVLPCVPS